MPFQTRNAYYLRISATAVLPLYVYLDDRHVNWMTDRVLQQVLEDLRSKIIPKLHAEANTYIGVGNAPKNVKQGTVDVHRRDTYQFAFFFRYTEPHAVLIKRDFVFAPQPPLTKPMQEPSSDKGSRKKKTNKSSADPGRNKRSRKARSEEHTDAEQAIPGDANVDVEPSGLTEGPRRSTRKKVAQSYGERRSDEDEDLSPVEDPQDSDFIAEQEDVEMTAADNGTIEVKQESDENPLHFTPGLDSRRTDTATSHQQTVFDVDEEEPKPKLAVQLKYQGFNISGRCLCVVVEPWPPMRSQTPARPATPAHDPSVRASSVMPNSSAMEQRAKTPLFYPDEDDDRRSVTPGPSSLARMRILPPVPLFDDPQNSDDDGDEDEGMMQFSQILRATGSVVRGNMEDDDEFDGAVLFADADEAREL